VNRGAAATGRSSSRGQDRTRLGEPPLGVMSDQLGYSRRFSEIVRRDDFGSLNLG
jgi:hypothetical protein